MNINSLYNFIQNESDAVKTRFEFLINNDLKNKSRKKKYMSTKKYYNKIQKLQKKLLKYNK